jgi:hypothetical protein
MVNRDKIEVAVLAWLLEVLQDPRIGSTMLRLKHVIATRWLAMTLYRAGYIHHDQNGVPRGRVARQAMRTTRPADELPSNSLPAPP